MNVDPAIQTFIEESEEILSSIEHLLASSTSMPLIGKQQEEMLRMLHTLKGSAGIFGFKNVVDFSHSLEQIFVDSHHLSIEKSLLFHDHLKALISAEVIEPEGEQLFLLTEKSKQLIPELRHEVKSKDSVLENADHPLKDWQVVVRFDPGVLADGVEPTSFLKFFNEKGRLSNVVCSIDDIPALTELDPIACYLSYRFCLRTGLAHDEIVEVFNLIENSSQVNVKPISSQAITEPGAIKQTRRSSVRVDADKLDELIDLVGELVIAGANNSLIASQLEDVSLEDANEHLSSLIERVRDSALCLRMVPISQVFNKFYRVVQDLKQKTGKRVELEIFGEDTELDRGLMEKVVDPLMHMLRNAIDHGVELPEERVAAGKNDSAKVTLSASHYGGSVHIEVKDDGIGLDKNKILTRAKQLGFSPDELQTDHAIYQLIFEPGFSTAEEVSEISGRGVGMDVVKSNILSMHGTIDVTSKEGKGTSFIIHLPLTLAIIDGFLVKVAKSSYVLHRDIIIECVDVNVSGNHMTGYVNLRGEVLPYICLKQLFYGLPTETNTQQSMVVVRYGEERIGLVVEDLRGEVQTVIKPLGELFKKVGWIIGSTILGTGEVAIILDVSGLINLFKQFHAKSVKSTKFK